MQYQYILKEDGGRILLDGGQLEVLQEDGSIILQEGGSPILMEEETAALLLEAYAEAINGVAAADASVSGDLLVRRLGTIEGEAVADATVTGELRSIRDLLQIPVDSDIDGQPRSTFPLIVYHVDARSAADLSAVPDNGYFLVSVLYNPAEDDPLFASRGGVARDIGQKIVITLYGTTFTAYRFRPALKNEVVCYKGSLKLYRFENDVWVEYYSYPERLLSSCKAFEIFDTEKIYNYFAKVLGAAHYKWSFDARRVMEHKVAGLCPTSRLPYLAEHFGQSVRADESEMQKRGKILLGMECSRNTGTSRGVELRLQSLGYVGSIHEVWVWPDHSEIYLRAPNQSAATPLVFVDLNKATAITTLGTTFSKTTRFFVETAIDWEVGDLIEITPINGIPAVFQIIDLISTVGGTLVVVSSVASAPYLAEGASVRVVIRSWLTMPHGFTSAEPVNYWPSSRCVVFYADKDGDAISEAPDGFSGIPAFHAFLAEQLYSDVLPISSDIRAFAPLVGYSKEGDAVAVSDTLSVTNLP